MIDEHPRNVSTASGDPITMTCSASGIPRPTVRWYKLSENSNLPLPASVNHQISVDLIGAIVLSSHLTISVTLLDDVASYFCAANNIIGSATSNLAHLTVNGNITEVILNT